MSEELSNNEAVEKALAIVAAIPDDEPDTSASDSKDTSGARQPEEASPSAKDGHSEHDAEPGPEKVTAPRSWKADARELFEKLPPELQQQVLDRESEQNSTFNRVVNEQREAKRLSDDARAKAAEDTKHYAEQIQQISQAVRFHDPIIAEANATDWDKLNRENPAEYVTRRHALERHMQFLGNIEKEQQRLQNDRFQEARQRELQQLFTKMPEMADEASASQIRGKMHSTLQTKYGFTQDELNSVNDHRTFMALVDAAKYHELMAAKSSVETKRTAQPAARVTRPQASRDVGNETSERFKSLRNKAIRSGTTDDAVAAVLSAIGE